MPSDPIASNAVALTGGTADLLVAARSGTVNVPYNVFIENTSGATIYLGFTSSVNTTGFQLTTTQSISLQLITLPLYVYKATSGTINVIGGAG